MHDPEQGLAKVALEEGWRCLSVLRGGSDRALDLRVQFPAGRLSRNIGQPCIPPGSLNRVSASAGGKGGILTSVGWPVTLCDPIRHVSFP